MIILKATQKEPTVKYKTIYGDIIVKAKSINK